MQFQVNIPCFFTFRIDKARQSRIHVGKSVNYKVVSRRDIRTKAAGGRGLYRQNKDGQYGMDVIVTTKGGIDSVIAHGQRSFKQVCFPLIDNGYIYFSCSPSHLFPFFSSSFSIFFYLIYFAILSLPPLSLFFGSENFMFTHGLL